MRMLRNAVPLVAVMLLVSCGSDATAPADDDPGATDQIGLAMRAVNTGAGNLVIDAYLPPHSITVCYEVHGCTVAGAGWSSINPGYTRTLAQSLPDSVAVGVRVNFVVVQGEGRSEIVRGVAYRTTNGGFLEFTEGPVVHTSATFAAGDTVSYTYGTVN
jgi:hypothetical protein